MRIKTIYLLSMILLCTSCDTQMSESNLQQKPRTMIIGGNPVHEHDYKVSTVNQVRDSLSNTQ